MKLYFKPGACSLASHIVLSELDVPFELEKADPAAGTTASGDDFRTFSPNGYVPALQIGEEVTLTENPAILQYLAARYPAARLAPSGLLERARLHELLNFISSELHKAFSPFFTSTSLGEAERTSVNANASARIQHIEDRLADGRDYLLGEYSVADAYAFVVLTWLPATDLSMEPWPHTGAFVERMLARPAVRRSMQTEGLIPAEAS
ncbi:MAG: glutathione S-transferase [Polyangiales bacterium]